MVRAKHMWCSIKHSGRCIGVRKVSDIVVADIKLVNCFVMHIIKFICCRDVCAIFEDFVNSTTDTSW